MASSSTSVQVPVPPSSEIAAGSAVTATEGPVLSVISKRLRALRKKHNRITQMEENLSQGKPLNKEQEEVLRSKPAVVAAIDELEKLRQPVASAVNEELSACVVPVKDGPGTEETAAAAAATASADDSADKAVEDLVTLLYFGCLFDVKPQSEFQATMLTRTHERGCCLTYDYVTDDTTDLLGEADLDKISTLGALITSRPSSAGVSHRNALQECVQHAQLWLRGADQPIGPGTSITYAGLRDKLKKILASDYTTATPEMKAPVDVAAAVQKYGASGQVSMFDANTGASQVDSTEVAPVPVEYQQKVDEQQDFRAIDIQRDQQSNAVDEPPRMGETRLLESTEDGSFTPHEQQNQEVEVEHNERDVEHNHQYHTSQRPYQNQRGTNRGGGRRGYANGRGGRGGYQSGKGQYYYSGYESRNYHNPRGRGGRGGGTAMHTNYGGGSQGGHIPTSVQLGSSA